jgi:hypothetical protein
LAESSSSASSADSATPLLSTATAKLTDAQEVEILFEAFPSIEQILEDEYVKTKDSLLDFLLHHVRQVFSFLFLFV